MNRTILQKSISEVITQIKRDIYCLIEVHDGKSLESENMLYNSLDSYNINFYRYVEKVIDIKNNLKLSNPEYLYLLNEFDREITALVKLMDKVDIFKDHGENTVLDMYTSKIIYVLDETRWFSNYILDEIKSVSHNINTGEKIKSIKSDGLPPNDKSILHNADIYTWDKKTDLVILIQALWKNESIKKNGKNIQRNELIELFSKVFNIDLATFDTLLSQGIGAKTKFNFIEILLQKITEHKDDTNRKKRGKEN